MDRKPPVNKPLALEPMDGSTRRGDAARTEEDQASADAKAQRDLRITTTDEFLAKAAKEYEEGHVDQALWRRAADQSGNDASLVVADYLRSRATALQLQHKQDQHSQVQARGASSTRGASDQKTEADPRATIVSTKFVGLRPRGLKRKLWYSAAAVAGLVSAVVFVYLLVSPRESEPVRQPIASTLAPAPKEPVLPTPRKGEQPGVNGASGGAGQASPEPSLAATVQQLKTVGKWNLLVLYAVEWTRREPDNVTAWEELSIGYAKLQQFNDALDAATKAVQLSPGDALLWRNLGRLNLDLDRLPEAGMAFAKALEVSPTDADALCGAALVARRQARPRDADTTTRRVKSADGSCPDESPASTAPAGGGSAARKPALPAGR